MKRSIPDTIRRDGIYHFKKRVPRELAASPEFKGAQFVQFSLATKNRSTAIRKAASARAAFDQRVADAFNASGRGSAMPATKRAASYVSFVVRTIPTPEIMLSVAADYKWRVVQRHLGHNDFDADQKFGHLISDGFVGGRPKLDWLDERDELEKTPFTVEICETADRLAADLCWDMPEGSNQYRQLCHTLRQARLSAIKVILESASVDGFDLLTESIPQGSMSKTYTVRQAATDYMTAKRHKAELVRKMPIALRAWEELIGIAPISLIKKSDVNKFRDKLKKVPARANDRFRGKTLPQAIEANELRKEPYPTLTPRTVKLGYISVLNTAVNEALRADKIEHNPFHDIRVEGSGDLNDDRRPFRDHELQKIFTHPIWTGCKSKEYRNTVGSAVIRDHYYWPPLISLFSGMRASEIGALELANVFLPEDDPLPHFQVRGTKTPSAIRDIPLHPRLLDIGFGEYVRKLRAEGNIRLFPYWKKPAGQKKYSMSPCQNNFNNKVLHKDRLGSAGPTFHCFRHTLENEMSKARFDEACRLRIMGHKLSGTQRNYRKPDLQIYHEPFCNLAFAQIDLSHLSPQPSK